MALDIEYVRKQFPSLVTEWTLMDNAGGSQILKGVVDKITQYYYSNNVQTGGSYELSQKAASSLAEGRKNIATLFNASRPEEIVFGPSTTVLMQFLAKAMAHQFQAGDEIVVTNIDHESNIGPWVQHTSLVLSVMSLSSSSSSSSNVCSFMFQNFILTPIFCNATQGPILDS